jgi:hypothetical protein
MRSFALLALLALLPHPAQAAVLALQPPVEGAPAFFATLRDPSLCCAIAEDFVLGSYSSLTEVRWWGVYGGTGGSTDDFLVDLYQSPLVVGSLPLASYTTPAVRTATALRGVSDAVIYEYRFELPEPVDLAPGTYFIGVRNSPSDQSYWYWQVAEGDAFWVRPVGEADPTPWQQQTDTPGLAFEIVGVPEPAASGAASVSILLLGAFGVSRRRR